MGAKCDPEPETLAEAPAEANFAPSGTSPPTAYTGLVQTVLDVSNDVAAELAGIGDGILDALRERLGCTVNLRGNRLTLTGDDVKVAEAQAVVIYHPGAAEHLG